MKRKQTFYITFNEDYFTHNSPIETELIALEKPHKKWYKRMFEFISFRLYEAPFQYKCKVRYKNIL